MGGVALIIGGGMPAEDTTEPMDGHRPLPSVDIPLLREERRATRARNLVAGVVLGVAVAGSTAAFVLTRASSTDGTTGEGPEGKPPAPADEAPVAVAEPEFPVEPTEDAGAEPPLVGADAPVTPGAVERKAFQFGQAPTFRHALTNAGLQRDETAELESALDDVLDFRRCRPAHRMVLERDTEGRIVLFEYHPGPTEYLQATRGGDGELRGERVEVPLEKKRITTGARVETSLGDALDRAGLGRSLVGLFVSVFEGRVNFTADTRQGDVFRVVVDEHHINGEFLRYGTAHALEYVGQRTGALRAFWYEPRDGIGDHYDETGRAVQGGWLRTPCRYDRISSRFNPRRMHPILRRVVPHNGVDYAAGSGTPIWAAADGKVTFAAPKGANGNLVSIRHADGYETLYAHLNGFARGIKSGVQVKQRQVIGYVGTTGRSTGPHLHFALKRHGRFLDPLEVINGPGRRLPSGEMAAFKRRMRKLEQELATIRVGSGPGPTAAFDPDPEPAEEPMD
jgi:murein DD-endopeptidase MepM/ murein hydrolase activator NlpD